MKKKFVFQDIYIYIDAVVLFQPLRFLDVVPVWAGHILSDGVSIWTLEL